MTTRSTLLIFSTDRALVAEARRHSEAHGWLCRHETEMTAALAALENAPAAIVVDQRLADAPRLVAEIRGRAPPTNATPILTAGGTDRGAAGAGGQLDLPLAGEDFLGLLRQWAGPLDDHTSRVEPWSFRYKLLRLIGLDNADSMLLRLRAILAEAVNLAAVDGAAVPAHRLAGLAGICGFPEVSQAWARVDRGEDEALPAAVAVSRKAIAALATIT